MNSEYEPDLKLKAELERLVMPPAPSGTWRDVQERARRKGWEPEGHRLHKVEVEEVPSDRNQAPDPEELFPEVFPPQRSRPRVAVYASIAVVLVAAVAVGSLEALKHLGGGQPILVITDETTAATEATGTSTPQTTVTSTPTQTTLTPAPAVAPTLGRNWQHLPLAADGGVVHVLVMDPTNPAVLYAITDSGLFKSTDGAAHWTKLSVEASWGATIVVDPASPSTLYVWASGLYRSLDGGATWTRIGDEIGIMHWWIDSSTSPSTLWGTSGRDGDDPNNVLYKSTDGGSTWEEFSKLSFWMDRPTIDPINHMLYAVYPTVGMRSFDGGATWEDVSAGLPVDTDRRLVLDPRDSSRLYLYPSNYPETLEFPVFVSTDKAQTWAELTGPELDWAKAVLQVDPATPAAAIEAAAAFLTDFDGTMTDASSGVQVSGEGVGWWQLQPWRVLLDPSDPSVVYVRTSGGVYKSTDQGATWNKASFGMTAAAVCDVLVDPLSPTTIYATTPASIAKSADGGASWATILELALDSQDQQTSGGSFLLAPSLTTRLYAASKNGLLRSDDGGATWTQLAASGLLDPTQENPEVDLMLVASDQPDTVFAKAWRDGCWLYRSTDGGNTWDQVTGLPDRPRVTDISLVQAPDDPSRLYAGVVNYGGEGEGPAYSGFFMSTDGGKTWAPAGDRSSWGFGVSALAIDPHNPLNICAAQSYQSLWRSTDGSETWTQVAEFDHFNFIGSGPQIIFDPRAPDTLYACANDGLYRSTDGGTTWQDMTEGRSLDELVPGAIVVSTCVIDPVSSNGLYAATNEGLYKWVSDDD